MIERLRRCGVAHPQLGVMPVSEDTELAARKREQGLYDAGGRPRRRWRQRWCEAPSRPTVNADARGAML